MKRAELVDEVRRAVRAGDAHRVAELVAAASETDRRAVRPVARDLWFNHRWDHETKGDQRAAATVAWLATETARELASNWFGLRDVHENDLALKVLGARGTPFLTTLVGRWVRADELSAWSVIRALVKRGVIERPDSDFFIRGMVWDLGREPGSGREEDAVLNGLMSDPGLLDEEVWRIFEVDATTELYWRHVWSPESKKGPSLWISALTRLAADGRLDRRRLLDDTLAALTRDFRPSRVAWHAQLHEALAPTHAERRERIGEYLTLLGSPVPLVVKHGLAALRAVEDGVDSRRLASAAAPVFVHRQKNLALEALRLLDHAAARDPGARDAVLVAVAQALVHERAEIQERAVEVLERHWEGAGGEARAGVLGSMTGTSPTIRTRIETLAGIAEDGGSLDEAEVPTLEELAARVAALPPFAREAARARETLEDVRAGRWPLPFEPTVRPELILRTHEPLAPIETLDELVELGAMLLESTGDGNDAERYLDGVCRLCDQRPPNFDRLTSALRKRAAEQAPDPEQREWWSWYPLGADPTELLAIVTRAWLEGRKPTKDQRQHVRGVGGFLVLRALEIAKRVARRRPHQLLAFPTHHGGWIDPDVLRQRLRSSRPLGDADDVQANLRATAVATPPQMRPLIRMESRYEWEQPAPRVVIEVDRSNLAPELRMLFPEPQAPSGDLLYGELAFGFPLGGWFGTRWALTAVPWLPELAFAAAARTDAADLERTPLRGGDAVLAHALGPEVRLGEMAWLLVAEALLGKAPDRRRLATDVLVASIEDGRFDPVAASRALGWLLENGLGKLTRLGPSLRDLARVSLVHAVQALRFVESYVSLAPAPRPGLDVILETALDTAVRLGAGIADAEARRALEQIEVASSRASKTGRAARRLLAIDAADSPSLVLARRAVAAGTVARAEWYAAREGVPAA